MKNYHPHRNQHVGWLACFTTLVIPLTVNAALPFTIDPGHPRIYVDQDRVDVIRNASQEAIPLNGSDFPHIAGSLVFDIKPVPRTDGTQSALLPILDNYNVGRNHIFLRHNDQVNATTGLTGCGTVPTDPVNLCFQLALQSKDLTGSYIAARNFSLTADQWHMLQLTWNASMRTVSLLIDGNEQTRWTNVWNVAYAGWSPDQQEFVFAGRDYLDDIRVYGTDDPSSGNLLVHYPMSDGSGIRVTDASGSGLDARISSGTTWVTRSAGDGNSAISMNGKTGKLSVIVDNVLTEAWRDFYAVASSNASSLNGGGSPAPVATAHPTAIINVARTIGLAYLVTKNDAAVSEQFKTAALKFADQLINEPVCSIPVDSACEYTEAGRIEAMGTLYDWLFDVVSTTARTDGQLYHDALADAIKGAVRNLEFMVCGSNKTITADWNCSTLPANPSFISGHSHQDNTQITAALLAIADEHPELDNLLTVEYQNFANGYNPARAWISIDGGHHMGWDYGAGYTFLDSIRLFNDATDLSMLENWQGKLIDRFIYALRSDMASYPSSGDAFTGGGMTPSHEWVTAFALWGSKYHGNTYGQRFYNRWSVPAKSGTRFSELLYWEPGLAETPLEDLDFSRHFRNAGQVLMRDTWDYADATLLEFKSTSFWSQNHHHMDQNAFTLFYRAPLLVDSGYYDNYGTSHWYNYFTRTIAHNSIIAWDPQESFILNSTTYSNDGGQRFFTPANPTLQQIQEGGSNHLDGVVAYEYSPDYTYTAGNASKAYAGPGGSAYQKLDQQNGFIRNLVFLRAPSFWDRPITVVFDKVTAVPGKESLAKRFLLHSATEPEPLSGPGITTVNGDTITIRNGGGMLFSQTLLPENPVLTKIGGKDGVNDFRFMAPAAGATDYLSGLVNFAPDPTLGGGQQVFDADADKGEWRIEVAASMPAQREYFLHVLSVADNNPSTTLPPEAVNLSTPDVAAVLLADQQHIVFAKADAPVTNIQWNTPSANATSLITGLASDTAFDAYQVPNGSVDMPYTMVLRGNPSGSLRSSGQGVIAINTTLPMATDLAITLTDDPDPVLQGSVVSYTARVTNNGPSAASGVSVSGLPGCALSVTDIPSGGSASCTAGVAATTAGVMTQSVSVTSNEYELGPANNSASAETTVTDAPDLVMTQVATTSSKVKRGNSLKVTNAVKNQGTVAAGASLVGFRLSLNDVYGDGDDVVIPTTRSVSSLGAGASSSVTTSISIPSSTAVNSYHVCAMADTGGNVAESNENNNTLCTAGKVNVTK